jgi:hypothetical protein
VNFDTEEDNEGCEIQKPLMKNDEDNGQFIDPMMNTIFIFNLQIKIITTVQNLGCKNLKMICQVYQLNQPQYLFGHQEYSHNHQNCGHG